VDVVLPDGSRLPVMIIDPLSAQLTTAATDDVLRDATATEWAVRTMTSIVLDHRASGRSAGRSRILTAPDLTAADPRLVAGLERLAATTPDVSFVAASTLIGVTDTQRSFGNADLTLPPTAGVDLVARIQSIDAARLDIASAGSMLAPDDPRLADWTATLDGLVSTGITNAEASAVVTGLLDETAALRHAIVLPSPFAFTLTGRSDEITLRLGNTGPDALTVAVRLQSSKLTFPDNDRVVTLRPNDSTDIQIPVRARSNGTSAVVVTVLTPLGEPIGEPVTLKSRVNALTGLGQVLTGGFVLMLAAWWFSNWRSRRRASLGVQ
jgi:hypothetical protein